jgi:hypothetical protein
MAALFSNMRMSADSFSREPLQVRRQIFASYHVSNCKLGRNVAHAKVEMFQVWIALKDVRILLSSLFVAAPALCVAAYGAFLPTFIKEFGFDPCE